MKLIKLHKASNQKLGKMSTSFKDKDFSSSFYGVLLILILMFLTMLIEKS